MNQFKSYCLLVGLVYSQIALGQQSLDAYITDSSKNNFVLVASSTNSLVSPIDLDFYPDQSKRPNELWILNQGTSTTGGSTEIVFNANQNSRTYKYIKDGNAWHFMAMTSAMAFGNNEWATSQDILDANRQGGKYTGPTLWPGDLTIYGIVGNPSTQTENGSHLSMIHQSPYGKGIAFEKDLIFWVLDGYEGNIKRYDFGNPHQPGGDDHSGGGVRVYTDFKFTRHSTLPAHIVIDAARKYLYGCDPVAKRVFRIDITTGTNNGARTKINSETLDGGYITYTGLIKVDSLITGLISPVGIDVYGNRLIVTDNGTDEIIIFDITNSYKEVGRIKLKYISNPDPMGVKVGPDGKIYFVDKTNRRAYLIDNSSVQPTKVSEIDLQNRFSVYPNPTSNLLSILSTDNNKFSVSIFNVLGENIFSVQSTSNLKLETTNWANGIYFIQICQDKKIITKKIIKQ